MSNPLAADLDTLRKIVEGAANPGRYAQAFHLTPPVGWLNDPNGLAQLGDTFHAYFQYSPFNAEGGVKQTAYQIVAGDWDSGKTASASMQAALPLPLRSRQRVVWKIRLWDENDRPGAWTEAAFETGLLDAAD